MKTRLPGRLLLRIYLVGLAQLLLIAFAFNLARRYAEEGNRPRFFERAAAYSVSSWSLFLDEPGKLRQVVDQAGQQLRWPAARLQCLAAPPAPVRRGARRLEQERMLSNPEPPHLVRVAIPEKGALRAYAMIDMPKPPGPPPDLGIMLAVVLGCTAITSIVFARSLAVPLQKLAAAARAFGGRPSGCSPAHWSTASRWRCVMRASASRRRTCPTSSPRSSAATAAAPGRRGELPAAPEAGQPLTGT